MENEFLHPHMAQQIEELLSLRSQHLRAQAKRYAVKTGRPDDEDTEHERLLNAERWGLPEREWHARLECARKIIPLAKAVVEEEAIIDVNRKLRILSHGFDFDRYTPEEVQRPRGSNYIHFGDTSHLRLDGQDYIDGVYINEIGGLEPGTEFIFVAYATTPEELACAPSSTVLARCTRMARCFVSDEDDLHSTLNESARYEGDFEITDPDTLRKAVSICLYTMEGLLLSQINEFSLSGHRP